MITNKAINLYAVIKELAFVQLDKHLNKRIELIGYYRIRYLLQEFLQILRDYLQGFY